MVGKLFKKIFGSRNERLVKSMRKTVAQINAMEAEIQALSDEQLQAKTSEFRNGSMQITRLAEWVYALSMSVRKASEDKLALKVSRAKGPRL